MSDLPLKSPNWRYWHEAAPAPDLHPEIYDQVLWRRPLGYLIDLAIVLAIFAMAWFVALLLGILTFGLLWPILALALALVPLAYHGLTIGGRRSATPGMRIMDITVRTWDGRRPGYFQAVVQTILFYATVGLTTWLILAVALFNGRRRCLHDYLCGTLVVRASIFEKARGN